MQIYTIPEAATRLRMGKTRLYAKINNGEIAAVKDSKRTLITESALASYIAALPAFPAKTGV
jgi:excisionase family DNA binding protein